MGSNDRYLEQDHFISYCNDLKVEVKLVELEFYHKHGFMYPAARLQFPEQYLKDRAMLDRRELATKWPDVIRLFDTTSPALRTDAELVDSFDRAFVAGGYVGFLDRPTKKTYLPWNSLQTTVVDPFGNTKKESRLAHYYAYWQVHQLYALQRSILREREPHFFHDQLGAAQIHLNIEKPTPTNLGRTFDGQKRNFDALYFYTAMHSRERERIFAQIPIYRVFSKYYPLHKQTILEIS